MTKAPRAKPKLTDSERHKRFVEMAREVEASDDPEDFERAFNSVAPVGAPQGRTEKSD